MTLVNIFQMSLQSQLQAKSISHDPVFVLHKHGLIYSKIYDIAGNNLGRGYLVTDKRIHKFMSTECYVIGLSVSYTTNL